MVLPLAKILASVFNCMALWWCQKQKSVAQNRVLINLEFGVVERGGGGGGGGGDLKNDLF